MSKVDKYLRGSFDHSEAEHEIEEISVQNSSIAENMGRIALRFISEKGLSDEFAQALKDIDQELEAERNAAPGL